MKIIPILFNTHEVSKLFCTIKVFIALFLFIRFLCDIAVSGIWTEELVSVINLEDTKI